MIETTKKIDLKSLLIRLVQEVKASTQELLILIIQMLTNNHLKEDLLNDKVVTVLMSS
jgi:hypothetical protein